MAPACHSTLPTRAILPLSTTQPQPTEPLWKPLPVSSVLPQMAPQSLLSLQLGVMQIGSPTPLHWMKVHTLASCFEWRFLVVVAGCLQIG